MRLLSSYGWGIHNSALLVDSLMSSTCEFAWLSSLGSLSAGMGTTGICLLSMVDYLMKFAEFRIFETPTALSNLVKISC